MYNTVKAAKMRRGSRMPALSSDKACQSRNSPTGDATERKNTFLCGPQWSVLNRRRVGGSLLKVGLTGGIASGKSVVGEMFVALGAHLVQADRIAHELMRPGQPVYNEVVRHFGGAILNPDLSVNRAKLAEAAFGPLTPRLSADDPAGTVTNSIAIRSRIEELNRIVHPAVIRSQEEWMEEIGRQDPRAIAIVEAALHLRSGRGETLRSSDRGHLHG